MHGNLERRIRTRSTTTAGTQCHQRDTSSKETECIDRNAARRFASSCLVGRVAGLACVEGRRQHLLSIKVPRSWRCNDSATVSRLIHSQGLSMRNLPDMTKEQRTSRARGSPGNILSPMREATVWLPYSVKPHLLFRRSLEMRMRSAAAGIQCGQRHAGDCFLRTCYEALRLQDERTCGAQA
jgi:hypothetical protein